MPVKFYYAYLVRCADETLYAGWALDVQKRVALHNRGRGAKYTRARLPVTLVGVWRFETQTQAMRWERWLKSLPRAEKLRLIASLEAPDDQPSSEWI